MRASEVEKFIAKHEEKRLDWVANRAMCHWRSGLIELSIRKRKDRDRVSWILDLVHPSTGKRHRFDTETKRAAEKLQDQKKEEWKKQEKLVGDPDTTLDRTPQYGLLSFLRLA